MGKKIPAKPLRLRASTILQKAGWPASLRRYYPRQVQNRVFLCDSRGQGAITLSQPFMAPPAGLRTVGLDPKECKQNRGTLHVRGGRWRAHKDRIKCLREFTKRVKIFTSLRE